MNVPIRVLVVDDSAFMRKMVSEILARDPEVNVVGTARDGEDALHKLVSLSPDVITLDVEMPILDGFGTLTEIMKRRPTPVVMLSSLTQAGADATMRCLELGAVDFVGKPSGSISLDIEKVGRQLTERVKAASTVRVGRVTHAPAHRSTGPDRAAATENIALPRVHSTSRTVYSRGNRENSGVLIIGSSTGGPKALQVLVPMLSAELAIPIVIVQHMPAGFTESLARRLDQTSPFDVSEAHNGDRLLPGHVLVAPGGRHLTFDANGTVVLNDDPPVHAVRPAVDVTVASLLRIYGSRTVAVLLTGMGKDGARGLRTVFDSGGITFAEDESTCVVYGMPKSAVELGGVTHLLPLHSLANAVNQICQNDVEAKKLREITL